LGALAFTGTARLRGAKGPEKHPSEVKNRPSEQHEYDNRLHHKAKLPFF
jgi:hypothetical protein